MNSFVERVQPCRGFPLGPQQLDRPVARYSMSASAKQEEHQRSRRLRLPFLGRDLAVTEGKHTWTEYPRADRTWMRELAWPAHRRLELRIMARSRDAGGLRAAPRRPSMCTLRARR